MFYVRTSSSANETFSEARERLWSVALPEARNDSYY